MEYPEHIFGNGLYLANLAVSSDILKDSWKVISEHQGQNPEIITGSHEDYIIIAFVGSPVTTSDLQQDSGLVPISENSDFKFLCSDTHPFFSINEAAFSLYNSLRGKFSQLQEKDKKEEPILYIITGHCLNGSVASLVTLWHLNTLDQTKYKLLCITFGSPLLGDDDFQQALSRCPTWNSCFLHVVHKDDCVPRLFLGPPTAGQSSYKPFGTFLLCSELGCACFQAPESAIELLMYESPIVARDQESQTFDYKNVIECLQKKIVYRNGSSFVGYEADSYKAGITAQVKAAGFWQRQRQSEGLSALTGKVLEHEQNVIKRQREEFDPDKRMNEMNVYLAIMEWYMEVCRANGQGPGYYDSFKNARERRNSGVDKYKTVLTDYWEKVVKEAEKQPQQLSAPLQNRRLFDGTTYRRIIEPLDIAEYYRRGRKDYLTRGRSKHYKRLEKWLEDSTKKEETKDGPSNPKVENLTEDSRFWAHVEEAIRSCRLLDRASSEQEKLTKFEKYVMDLIEKQTVSSDIFLEKSSYMQWWKEYQDKVSHQSPFVNYMSAGRCKGYGKNSQFNSNGNPFDTPPGPATSGDCHR